MRKYQIRDTRGTLTPIIVDADILSISDRDHVLLFWLYATKDHEEEIIAAFPSDQFMVTSES